MGALLRSVHVRERASRKRRRRRPARSAPAASRSSRRRQSWASGRVRRRERRPSARQRRARRPTSPSSSAPPPPPRPPPAPPSSRPRRQRGRPPSTPRRGSGEQDDGDVRCTKRQHEHVCTARRPAAISDEDRARPCGECRRAPSGRRPRRRRRLRREQLEQPAASSRESSGLRVGGRRRGARRRRRAAQRSSPAVPDGPRGPFRREAEHGERERVDRRRVGTGGESDAVSEQFGGAQTTRRTSPRRQVAPLYATLSRSRASNCYGSSRGRPRAQRSPRWACSAASLLAPSRVERIYSYDARYTARDGTARAQIRRRHAESSSRSFTSVGARPSGARRGRPMPQDGSWHRRVEEKAASILLLGGARRDNLRLEGRRPQRAHRGPRPARPRVHRPVRRRRPEGVLDSASAIRSRTSRSGRSAVEG